MADEYGELDLDLSGPPPARPADRSRVGLYAFLAFVLAVACAFLVWERNENVAALASLEESVPGLKDQRDELRTRQDEVGDALVNLSDYAAAQAELHHSLGKRKQALADLDQAICLFELAKKMGKCGCGDTHGGQVDRKIKAVRKVLRPTKEELPGLAAKLHAGEAETEPTSEDEVQPEATEPAGEPW